MHTGNDDGRANRGDSEIDLFVGAWWAGMAVAFTILAVKFVWPSVGYWM